MAALNLLIEDVKAGRAPGWTLIEAQDSIESVSERPAAKAGDGVSVPAELSLEVRSLYETEPAVRAAPAPKDLLDSKVGGDSPASGQWHLTTEELLEMTDSDLTIMEMLDGMEARGIDPMARMPPLSISETKSNPPTVNKDRSDPPEEAHMQLRFGEKVRPEVVQRGVELLRQRNSAKQQPNPPTEEKAFADAAGESPLPRQARITPVEPNARAANTNRPPLTARALSIPGLEILDSSPEKTLQRFKDQNMGSRDYLAPESSFELGALRLPAEEHEQWREFVDATKLEVAMDLEDLVAARLSDTQKMNLRCYFPELATRFLGEKKSPILHSVNIASNAEFLETVESDSADEMALGADEIHSPRHGSETWEVDELRDTMEAALQRDQLSEFWCELEVDAEAIGQEVLREWMLAENFAGRCLEVFGLIRYAEMTEMIPTLYQLLQRQPADPDIVATIVKEEAGNLLANLIKIHDPDGWEYAGEDFSLYVPGRQDSDA